MDVEEMLLCVYHVEYRTESVAIYNPNNGLSSNYYF